MEANLNRVLERFIDKDACRDLRVGGSGPRVRVRVSVRVRVRVRVRVEVRVRVGVRIRSPGLEAGVRVAVWVRVIPHIPLFSRWQRSGIVSIS